MAETLAQPVRCKHLFSKKGVIAVEKSAASEDQLMDIVLEAGGEDLNDEGETWEIITDPASYEAVLNAVKAAGIPTVMSEVTMVASTYTKLDGAGGQPDDAAAGGARRFRRHAECLFELRHDRRADGAGGGLRRVLPQVLEGPPIRRPFLCKAGNKGTGDRGIED